MNGHSEDHWTLIGRSVAYEGRVTLVEHAVVLPDGSPTSFEVDESVPFSVAALVIHGADVLLSRQYRYPIDRWIATPIRSLCTMIAVLPRILPTRSVRRR